MYKDIEVLLDDYGIDAEELYTYYEEAIVKAEEEWSKNCIKDISDDNKVYLVAFFEYKDKKVKTVIDWVNNIDIIENETEVIRVNIIEPAQVMSADIWLKGNRYYEITKEITEEEKRKYYMKFSLIKHRFEDIVALLINELECT